MPSGNTDRRPRFKPRLSTLEDRSTPAQFGVPWGDPTHLTLSFVPDGTAVTGTTTSTLNAKLDEAMPRAAWQQAVLRAVETWSELAGVTVALAADGGQAFGTTGPTQGDARFGDIRVGGVPMTAGELAEALPPDPFVSGTMAGDVFINTSAKFTPDTLYAVALHEVGHALGLPHSTDPKSVMFSHSSPTAVPIASDISAIRALYGARPADLNEGAKGNDTTKNATRIRYLETNHVDDPTLPAVAYGDITTRADVDNFYVNAPLGYTGSMSVRVQTAGVSLLNAKVTVTDAAGKVLGTATGSALGGDVLTVTLPAVASGAQYFVRVEGAPGVTFGVGRYGVGVTFNGLVKPTALSLDQALRGPYESLSREDMARLFRDPTHALYSDDLHTNDTVAVAANLDPAPVFATNTKYTTIASLADAADADFYRVRAPDVRTPVVLTATARAVGPNGVAPRVELFDHNNIRVPSQVIANGNGTFTVQATGQVAGKASYYVRVFGNGAATGNYALDVTFGTTAAASTTFASGSFSSPGAETGYTLYVGRTELFGFALSASGAAGSGSVRMTVRRVGDPASAAPVFELTAATGDTVTGMSALLPPGEYRVTFTQIPGVSPTSLPVSFTVRGSWLTDPVGPVALDPTLTPQYKAPPTSPAPFLYPVGTTTFDPFKWVFLYTR